MPPKFYIKTYGCQMNELDGSQMGRLMKREGYEAVSQPEDADVVLINTCSIREKASHKVYSDVGRFRSLKLQNPDVVLGVTGCQAQAEGMRLQKRFPYLDLVLGPDHTAKLGELVAEIRSKRRAAVTQVGFEPRRDYRFLNLLPDEDESHVKAFLTIMKGCDNFCSFCIVPFVRGREVCRPADEIVQEVQELAERGVAEITLLGQNVNSYGAGRHAKDPGAVSFPRLMRRLADETGVRRIRFTTSHPKDLSDELIEEFKSNPKLAQHFHLPVQSGSNAVLERMYREYTKEHYLGRLKRLCDANPQIALSTDIIVGFPGETEAEFQATMDLLEEVGYDSIYSFVYSPRPKTTAALHFKDDVPEPTKKLRLSRLQALQESITLRKNLEKTGQVLQVLVEGPSRAGGSYYGRSSQNHAVHFPANDSEVGQILPIKISDGGPNSLLGEKHG